MKRPGNVNNPRGVAKLYGGRHFVSPFVVRLPWECAEEGQKNFLSSFDGDVEACASGSTFRSNPRERSGLLRSHEPDSRPGEEHNVSPTAVFDGVSRLRGDGRLGDPSDTSASLRLHPSRSARIACTPCLGVPGFPVPRRLREVLEGRLHCARPRRARNSAHAGRGSQGAGSTGDPATRSSKCRCGPVESPVLPTVPSVPPRSTASPSRTRIPERCA